ncbi:hypothetical protein BVRB_7g178110 [Beta vulgaris subsp. vulgaris]|nr:hypothetical protein BVRB_7g178110 [Beta vulgaris subsp. vulgaris]
MEAHQCEWQWKCMELPGYQQHRNACSCSGAFDACTIGGDHVQYTPRAFG